MSVDELMEGETAAAKPGATDSKKLIKAQSLLQSSVKKALEVEDVQQKEDNMKVRKHASKSQKLLQKGAKAATKKDIHLKASNQ